MVRHTTHDQSPDRPLIRLDGVTKRFDDETALDGLDLSIADGEFLTILGPSGCGKTTILRLIAGFEEPTSGRVLIAGEDVSHIPPDRRQVNTVFQSYALFPHMSVAQNVGFGLRMAGVAEAEARHRVGEALRMVGLERLGHRRPNQLSGGQQQRVAIARAVVNKPRALLLDEPLSALDYKLRQQMQAELKQLRRTLGITFVFVTHDQEEAFSMSDRVVVMNEGRIEQDGTPVEVYETPVNLFVANFVGQANLLDAVVVGREGDVLVTELEGRPCRLGTRKEFLPGAKVQVLLRPEDILVEEEVPEDSEELWLPGRIEETMYKGTTWDMVVALDCGKTVLVTEFFDEDSEEMFLEVGDRVFISWYQGWEVVLGHAE